MLKIKVDTKSLFKKGVRPVEDNFAVHMICGYQGSGKTWYSIYLMEKQKGAKIYTNIRSYRSTRNKVVYFSSLEEIYNNIEDNCIFLIDELSKRFTKDSKIDKEFYSWLQQSRKHKRYVYMIMQEYIQVPQWLRGIATTIYSTSKVPLLPLFKTSLGTPVLNEKYEWDLNVFAVIFYKRTQDISNCYDTFESIDSL